jgi:hypothetical protein
VLRLDLAFLLKVLGVRFGVLSFALKKNLFDQSYIVLNFTRIKC